MKTLKTLLTFCGVFFGLYAAQSFAKEKPNIVLIMANDVSRDWISCYGAKHKTPNIDRLASQGLRFNTAWSMPICTPTRVTLLTGQYPFHHGWTKHYDVPRWGGEGLSSKKFTTFARVLRDAGYATAIGGKWQINNLREQPDALFKHGFDEHCVWTGMEAGHPETGERYFNGHLLTNGKRSTAKYGPDTINAFLMNFIRRHKTKPFLVYYPMLLTHGPHGATPANAARPPESKHDLFAANVSYMDKLVGQLVQSIDALGLRKNTLIVFTTDNGSSVAGTIELTVGKQAKSISHIPEIKEYPKGKGRLTDVGVHVPLIVRAPFLVPEPGTYTRDLVDFTDFFPTFVELAGAELPKDTEIDGQSFVPSLRGEEDPFLKRNWIFAQVGGQRMIRDWNYLYYSDQRLYGISFDPKQRADLLKVKHNDKIAPSAHSRLSTILSRFPKKDAAAPFAMYGKRHASE